MLATICHTIACVLGLILVVAIAWALIFYLQGPAHCCFR